MIFIQLNEQLTLLTQLLCSLNNDQYNQPISFLGNASIGGHTRHIIELLKCAADGYNKGTVDYLNRSRDLSIEKDKTVAMEKLRLINRSISKPDKQLNLVTECDGECGEKLVNTTYFREIVYNTEHTIHHLALIKVALKEMNIEMQNSNFGMAYSTIKYLAEQQHTNQY